MGVVRGLILVVGLTLILYAAYIAYLTIRYRSRGDTKVAATHAVLRALAGSAAVWLYFNGGQVAAWTMIVFFVGDQIWREILRRRRGPA